MIINKLQNLLKAIPTLTLLCTSCLASMTSHAAPKPAHLGAKSYDTKNLSGLSPTVLKEAINGYQYAIAHNDVNNKSVLTIVNFTEPSYQRRMWVIDTKTGNVLLAMHVAQGKNTGLVKAKHFSNKPGSDESSPGIYTTANEYVGKHGKSMRVNGLEKGINGKAEQRAIVIHPAWYLKPSFIKKHGYAGRSWGCFAVNPKRLDNFIDTINHQSVLFAYAPTEQQDQNVAHSLNSAGEALYQKIENGIHQQLQTNPNTNTQLASNAEKTRSDKSKSLLKKIEKVV